MARKPIFSITLQDKTTKERINLLTIWPPDKFPNGGGASVDFDELAKLVKLGNAGVKDKYWVNWNKADDTPKSSEARAMVEQEFGL